MDKYCEAIETLECIYPSQKQIVTGEYPDVAEALDLAIDAIRHLQISNETMTYCRDCIKKQPFQGKYICLEYGGIWDENDGCTHGERKPEGSENNV